MEKILRYYVQAGAESADAFAARYPNLFLLKHAAAVATGDLYLDPSGEAAEELTAATSVLDQLKGSTALNEDDYIRDWLVVAVVVRRRQSSPPKVTYIKNKGLMVHGAGAQTQPLVAGRAAGADVRLPFASVSKRHAHLFVASDTALDVVDQSSKHGTFVNGQRLTPGVRVRARVHDQIQFGRLLVELVDARTLHRVLVSSVAP